MPEQLLSQLAPLRTPSAVTAWPPAPGWWFGAIVVAVVVGIAVSRGLRHWRANGYRRHALTLLRNMDPTASAADINEILKITALQAFPREQVASLSGDAWVHWLQRQCPELDPNDLTPLKQIYNPESDADTGALHSAALRWVRQHGRAHV